MGRKGARVVGQGVSGTVKGRPESAIQWLAGHVFPFERELRARLRRSGSAAQEIDDIVQDAYLQLAALPDIDHIRDGRAYLFATAQAVLLNRVRHERVVRIDQLADREALSLVDDAPGPERRAQARQELAHVGELIRQLPLRCRQIFELRRVEGVSQRAIAEQLGISEHMVAYEASRGLRLVMAALRRGETAIDATGARRFVLVRRKRGRPRK